MERSNWLKEKRRESEARYDTLHASSYDQNWGHMYPTHRSFLQRFITVCPPGCVILDAACGTGKYWPLMLDSGRSVVAIDIARLQVSKGHSIESPFLWIYTFTLKMAQA